MDTLEAKQSVLAIGQAAYTAYKKEMNKPLPEWDELSEASKSAFTAAGCAGFGIGLLKLKGTFVINQSVTRKGRQVKEY